MNLEKLQKTADSVQINNLRDVKLKLIFKYNNLSKAAKILNVRYDHLSSVIGGRLYTFHIVSAIQKDLGLSNEQVLELWPLLRKWPRESMSPYARERVAV